MLRYELRHFQSKDNLGNNIIYQADAQGRITIINGVVPSANWVDYTEWMIGGQDIEIDYTIDSEDNESGEIDFGYNISEKVEAFGEAAKFIKNWLVTHSAGYLNIIEVRITDTDLNIVYPLGQIKQAGIPETCLGDCNISFTIKQQDQNRDDLDKMVIYDNFENTYNSYPNGVIPAFEIMRKPFDLTSLSILSALIFIIPLTTIAFILSSIGITLPSWADVRKYIMRKLGVGRAIPAPKITTYLDNISSYVNISIESTFHNMLPEEGNLTYYSANKYSNICMAYMSGDDGLDIEDTAFNVGFWRNTYAPVWSARRFLNNLSKHFNLKWRIYKDKLILRSVKWWDLVADNTILFDFTGADESQLVEAICFEQSNKKQPDYIDAIYTEDSAENLGNESITRYNDVVDYNRYADNRVLDGSRIERSEFAPTAFYSDGIGDTDDEDWITNWYDYVSLFGYLFIGLLAIIFFILIAMNVAAIGGVITAPIGVAGTTTIGIITAAILVSLSVGLGVANNDIKAKYDGGIIIDSKNWSNPKLLHWDESTGFTEAQVVSNYEINSTGTAMGSNPPINNWYNPVSPPVVPPFHNHYAQYIDKIGNVQKHDTNNSTLKYVKNYRLFFEPDFEDNIQDDLWQYEDPNKHRSSTNDFIAKICISRENILKLGLQQVTNSATGNQASDVQLLKRIAVYNEETNIKRYGKLLHVKLSYKTNSINLRGRII